MSYNFSSLVEFIYPSSIMPNDWLALTSMYRPNKLYHQRNDHYSINGNERKLELIIDQGGIDKIDAYQYDGNAVINLQPGVINTIGKYRFIIATDTTLENVRAAMRENSITDNNADNTIDLRPANGACKVLLTKGNDKVLIGSGSTRISIDVQSGYGIKHIRNFNMSKDSLFLANIKKISANNSVTIESDDVTIILDNLSLKDLPKSFFAQLQVEPQIQASQTLTCVNNQCNDAFDQQRDSISDEDEISPYFDENHRRHHIDDPNAYEVFSRYNARESTTQFFSKTNTPQTLYLPTSSNPNNPQFILLTAATASILIVLSLVALYLIYRAMSKTYTYTKSSSLTLFSGKRKFSGLISPEAKDKHAERRLNYM